MLPNHMTPSALPQRLERKEEKKPVDWAKALYPPDGKLIQNYLILELKDAERQIQETKDADELKQANIKKNQAEEQMNSFKNQLFKLISSLETWAKDNSCYDEVKNSINVFRSNIFHEAYTGDQSELYFTTIKLNLEKIWFQLHNATISFEKRKKIFTELCPQLAMCGPGVYGHIQDAALRLESPNSVEAWLAAERRGIVQFLASRHIEEKKVKPSMQVHVHNRFNREGEKNFGLPTRVSGIVDVYEHSAGVKITEKTMQQFKENFLKEYTPQGVVDCVTSNLCDEIAKVEKENNIKKDKEGRFPYDRKIIEQFQALFKRLDLEKLQESAIFEMEESKEGQYTLRFSSQKLREQVAINSGLFDESPVVLPNGHMYFTSEYAPASDDSKKEIKFSANQLEKNWESLPAKEICPLFYAIEETSPKFLESLFSKEHSSSLKPIILKLFNEAIEQDDSVLIKKILTAGGSEFANELIHDLPELSAEKKEEMLKSLQELAKQDSETKDSEMKDSEIKNIEIKDIETKDSEKKETKEKYKGFLFFKGLKESQKELQQAKELCQLVVHGKYDQVKAMLEKNPRLVLYRRQVEDYSYGEIGDKHREIEGTAYQMALGAGDVNRAKLDANGNPLLDAEGNVQVLHENEGMAEMIRSYFIKAYNNDESAANTAIHLQQEEQFPGGYDAYQQSEEVQNKKANDSKALHKVIAAIAEAKVSFTQGRYCNDVGKVSEITADAKCEAALKEFWEYLKPKETIKRGEHFNIDLLIEAFKLYDDKKRYRDFGSTFSWEGPQNVLMWRKVIGYIQRFLPACYAQAFFQGLGELVNCNEKFSRAAKFEHRYYNVPLFPLDSDPSSRLGHHYATQWRSPDPAECMSTTQQGQKRGEQPLQDLYQAKATTCRELMPQGPDVQPGQSMCIVM